LNKDFKKGLQVRMVRRKYGSRIFDKIYSNLQDSTLGIVILTKDVEGKNDKFYAKPNIYHELGFLMGALHHLNTKELSKVLILKEEGVEVPSNVPDYDSVRVGSRHRLCGLDIHEVASALQR
jgi:predicted nucleotide-binding protein